MILYRACSKKEFENTKNTPHFIKRYKYFSPSLNFVESRVMDGKFNNSNWKTYRYTHLLIFEIKDEDCKHFTIGKQEWKIDRRKAHNVKWRRV